jgi:beta-phosphoglucomutase-like phosphatase (HAD superfamily)
VTGHLERVGLGSVWDCVRCRDDVREAKPAPDLYLAALECMGLAAAEAVAIEDSPNGIAAAKAAGLLCVAVPGPLTQATDLGQADLHLSSLAELPLAELLLKVSSRRGLG